MYWLILMVFVEGTAPVVQHVGNFATAAACSSAAKEAQINMAEFPMTPEHGGAVWYRAFCVPASDGKAPAPN